MYLGEKCEPRRLHILSDEEGGVLREVHPSTLYIYPRGVLHSNKNDDRTAIRRTTRKSKTKSAGRSANPQCIKCLYSGQECGSRYSYSTREGPRRYLLLHKHARPQEKSDAQTMNVER